MQSLYLLITHIILPLLLVLWLGVSRFADRAQWLTVMGVVLAYGVLIGAIGLWGHISFYFPILFLCLFLFAFYRSSKKLSAAAIQATQNGKKADTPVYRGIRWFALIVLLLVDGWVLSGYVPVKRGLDVSFPLTRGVYYTWNGGGSMLTNHCPFRREQKHSIDLVKLNLAGVRRDVFGDSGLRSYEIFGEVIKSPCRGTVAKVVDGVPDRIKPQPGEEGDPGNLLVLECAGVSLYFLHLLDGSIKAQVGDVLETGEYLGLVGNSGGSMEPHLHIHAERGGRRGVIFSGESVPLRFNERYLVRNSLVIR